MDERLISLIGEENVEKINKTKVILVGIGGVGGIALEALVRSGINNITIYDNDKFVLSNLNRQIISNTNNIGHYKVKEAIKRMKSINPEIKIKGISEAITKDNVKDLVYSDYIIDACDDLDAKVALIKYAKKNNVKIISALGTGKRLNPTGVVITTLENTQNDALAKKLRGMLRKEEIDLDIPVVYASDTPLNNDRIVASSIFPPAVAGLYLAYYVIDDIIKE